MDGKAIVIWPDKVLTHPTGPVRDFGPDLKALVERMRDVVREADGIGIAANQIGVPLRVALVMREEGSFFEIVNPTLLEKSGPVKLREGCLSVPEEFDEVDRFERVRVRYQDCEGGAHEEEVQGRLAHIFQHEIDHLDGHVFVELLSPLKRGLIRSKMERVKKMTARRRP
jgi:peptide deformylase